MVNFSVGQISIPKDAQTLAQTLHCTTSSNRWEFQTLIEKFALRSNLVKNSTFEGQIL